MTTKENVDNEPSVSENTVPSPGMLLTQAREAAGLSHQEVAQQLKLKVQTVRDIENDHYDKSISPTFTKGYLRAYARLVAIDEKQVVDGFDEINHGAPEVVHMQSFSKRLIKQTNDNRLMRFTYLIAFVIFLLLVMWWWEEYGRSQFTPVPLEAPQLSENELATPEVNTTAPQVPAPAAPSASTPSAPAPESEALSQQAEPAPVVVSQHGREPQLVTPEPVVEVSTPSQNQAPTASNDESPVAEVDSTPVFDLAFRFEQDCWIEVKDAKGKRLAVGTMVAGKELNLNGQAPFSIVLGTNYGVSLQHKGQSVDLSRYRRGQVVRMQIPAN